MCMWRPPPAKTVDGATHHVRYLGMRLRRGVPIVFVATVGACSLVTDLSGLKAGDGGVGADAAGSDADLTGTLMHLALPTRRA